MQTGPFTTEDSDATKEMPQLDIRTIAASLERVDGLSDETLSIASPVSNPDWQLADRLAELQDKVANLQAALTESEHRYSRLLTRHETLLQKLHEREAHFAGKQHELRQSLAKITHLEVQRLESTKATTALKAARDKLLREVAQHDRDFAANQAALTTAQQQLEKLSSDSESLQRLIKKALQQRKQRDQFILKQAGEIKRLREFLR